MKKLILLLTLTMMFGQTKLETRAYELNITSSVEEYIEIEMFDMTGYNLDFAQIHIGKVSNYNSNTTYESNFYLRQKYIDASGIEQWSGGGRMFQLNAAGDILYFDGTVYYDGNHQVSIYHPDSTIDSATITLLITAEFPQEDTGYIEDGFDYCVEPGANLMSYPCDSNVALLDAIPSDALSQFSGIIGQGLASVQLPDGTWVGSLTNMQASSGYWITSTTSLCFNYDCSEN